MVAVGKKQTESKAKSTYSKLNTLKARLEDCHHPATIAELAEYMECNPRTIFRYFDTLKKENCGFRATRDDPYRYFIQKETVKRPDPVVRLLETVDSHLSAAAEIPSSKLVRRAISMLKGAEGAGTVNEAMTLDSDFIVDLGPFSEYDPSANGRDAQERNIDKYLDAIKHRAFLNVTYDAATKGITQELLLKPLKLILRMGILYLAAVDDAVGKTKLFAVKRIKRFNFTGKYFSEIEFNAMDFYKFCFGKFGPQGDDKKIKLLITVKAPWLEAQIRESHFNPPVKTKKQNPMVAEFTLYDSPDLRSWLLSILPYIEIQEPASLKAELKDLVKKSLEAL
jgi:predicted DNA-binding transcriptional regulator YafY